MKIKTLLVSLLTLGITSFAQPAVTYQNFAQLNTTNKKEWKKLEETILENASKNKTIMFGEGHWQPPVIFGSKQDEFLARHDSDFVADFLPRLKDCGFRYLAIEHERNPLTEVKKTFADYAYGKITRKELDRWSLEEEKRYYPGWFDLIDAARKAKVKIVCYDANKEEFTSWNHREEIAFNNLKELIFDKDPNAKVIIYCGVGHLNEKPLYNKNIAGWEEGKGLMNKDGKYICLGFHLDKYTEGKNFTVSLVENSDAQIDTPYCDIMVRKIGG